MKLVVLGAYLPRLTPERLAAWIVEDVQDFANGIRELKQRGLAQTWSEEEIDQRAAELPQELRNALEPAALFEILVEEHDGSFDPFSISESKTTSVAWEPVYLGEDGNEVIAESNSALSETKTFRVAFYIHDWPEAGILLGPAGVIELPKFDAVPERLWRLAPYYPLD